MGKIGFTPLQEEIFKAFSKEKMASDFYFTGGTALSVFHLNHRISDDLDFFSEKDFDNDSVIDFVKRVSEKLNLKYRFTQRHKARIFEFMDKDKLLVKVDFVHYPYKRIGEGKKHEEFWIDSMRDIATNKLLTINQRDEIKDYVDLYFLLKKYTIWDLIYGVETKFRMEFDMILIASDFLKVENFDVMPKMIKSLDLKTLKSFFRTRAKEIGKKVTKK